MVGDPSGASNKSRELSGREGFNITTNTFKPGFKSAADPGAGAGGAVYLQTLLSTHSITSAAAVGGS